jgi:MoxR-like ATPase
VQGLQREKVALEDLIKNLRADWNTVLRLSGQDEGADERRTQELWQPYIRHKASDFERKRKSVEVDCLFDADEYLRSKKLYFPKRVLKAFHTSLKVTDISPLVVLAGISGTGKSELPRRYAEAMGMHFLNVAVQPRWDSPQDMFGFFNYLENRYRATELGRALVQMDPFYQEANRGWTAPKDWEYSLSSQLLLVLLDEMNLARVEYYFSEFLSRLETRRGIVRDDPESRRKAEIGLEVGAGKSKAPIMQLFVDRNVLFVGTMNEDETTQALSDKVIDRANVLRFGRPGRVDSADMSVSSLSMNTRIEYSLWNSWCRSPDSLSDNDRVHVMKQVDLLDKAMTEIKRPFGFRTRNSILSYVANYPSADSDSADDAIADQIEQKILPKFRGLDSRDTAVKSALSKVKSVLGELKDELLINAIDQSSKDGQFVWMGVNRFEEEFSAVQ